MWGGDTEQKKIAWVNWGSIYCLPKEKRGYENQGSGEIQFCSSRKMASEFVSPPRRTVGSSFGLNMEDGGTWMRQEGTTYNLYGGRTLVSFVIRLRRGADLKVGQNGMLGVDQR